MAMALKQPHFPSELDSQEARLSSPRGRGDTYRRTHSPLLQEDLHRLDSPDAPRTPTMDLSMQDAMLDRGDRSPDQQRQSNGNRYSSAANTTSNRRPTAQVSPPQSQSAFFSGPPRVDLSDDQGPGSRASGNPRRRVPRHARRQSESLDATLTPTDAAKPPQNGAAPLPASYHEAVAREVQIPPQQQQRRPVSPSHGGLRPADLSSEISRMGSPSVATSVLKPLESKMREYHELMDDAQRQLAQLDNELIALQERRRQAEERFVDAKAKHDTYERQHADVERALRGEFQQLNLHQQQQLHQNQFHQQPHHSQPQLGSRPSLSRARPPSMDSFDDRPMSGQSKGRGRFRLSLFR